MPLQHVSFSSAVNSFPSSALHGFSSIARARLHETARVRGENNFPVRNSWKTSGSLGGPAGGGGCWTTGIGVRPRRPRRERSRSRKMQLVGATRDGMSRARAHGPTIRGEKGAEAAGYEIMKITCHGEVNGWGRTLGISGAGQARHEGEEEKGTRNAHLSDASLDTELLARRENDRPNPPVILFPRTTFFVVDPAGYFGFASISSSQLGSLVRPHLGPDFETGRQNFQ